MHEARVANCGRSISRRCDRRELANREDVWLTAKRHGKWDSSISVTTNVCFIKGNANWMVGVWIGIRAPKNQLILRIGWAHKLCDSVEPQINGIRTTYAKYSIFHTVSLAQLLLNPDRCAKTGRRTDLRTSSILPFQQGLQSTTLASELSHGDGGLNYGSNRTCGL